MEVGDIFCRENEYYLILYQVGLDSSYIWVKHANGDVQEYDPFSLATELNLCQNDDLFVCKSTNHLYILRKFAYLLISNLNPSGHVLWRHFVYPDGEKTKNKRPLLRITNDINGYAFFAQITHSGTQSSIKIPNDMFLIQTYFGKLDGHIRNDIIFCFPTGSNYSHQLDESYYVCPTIINILKTIIE
jgi:hypothetical protein